MTRDEQRVVIEMDPHNRSVTIEVMTGGLRHATVSVTLARRRRRSCDFSTPRMVEASQELLVGPRSVVALQAAE